MSELIYPEILYDTADKVELAARLGRFAILEEMGFFGVDTNTDLAMNSGSGSWMAQVRKRFSGMYGDVAGCHPADIEVAAEMLGVFDDVFDVEVQTRIHLGDRNAI